VHQPDPGANRAVDQSGQISEESLHAAQAPRREGRPPASRQDRREAHALEREAIDLYRRLPRRPVQAGSLSVLMPRTSAQTNSAVILRRPFASANGRLEGWPQARSALPSFETAARYTSGLLRMTLLFAATL